MDEVTRTITIDFDKYTDLIKKEEKLEIIKRKEEELDFKEKVFVEGYRAFEKISKNELSFYLPAGFKNKFYPKDIIVCGKDECLKWLEKKLLKLDENYIKKVTHKIEE